jgi:hypothetical protein
MKQTRTVSIILGLLIVFGLVFLYLRGAFHSEPEVRKEEFAGYSQIIQETPQNYFHNEKLSAGLPVCEPGNLGCYRTNKAPRQDDSLLRLFEIIMGIVPAGSKWVMVESEPMLIKNEVVANSRKMTAEDFAGLSKDKLRLILAKTMCAAYGICVSTTTAPDPKCDTTPLTLECMQSMFIDSGCNQSGYAFPTKEVVSRVEGTPQYFIYKFALDLISKANTMPADFTVHGVQVKPAAAILCGLPIDKEVAAETNKNMVTAVNVAVGNAPVIPPSYYANSSNGSNKLSDDPCEDNGFQISYLCLKKKLYDIYLSQAK